MSAIFLAASCSLFTDVLADEDIRFVAQEHQSTDWRYYPTLFTWRGADLSKTDDEESKRLVTDRPHFSEASSLVGLGVVQLETGYTYFRDNDDGLTQTHSFPEPLLRAGVFADWFEFRLAYNYLIETKNDGVNPSSRLSGSDDLYVGAKLALAKQSGCLPEVALFPQMRVPSGSSAFTSGQVLPGFNFAYSWVINDWLEIECNTQLNRRLDDADQFYTQFIQTANFEYELTERIGAFTEWFCFVPTGVTVAQTQHYLHGGFVYFPSDNIQLDIHAGFGANQAADDFFGGVGFSIRFP